MPKKPTHIILQWPSADKEIIFRASDGMMLAERLKNVLIWGEIPKDRTSRLFLETEGPNHYAADYLRDIVAVRDLQILGIQTAPVFDERCEEGAIIAPAGALDDLRFNSGTPMRKIGGKYVNGKLSAN